ncbi:uncharacterized protein LOC123653304 [Pipistrellus kuhlii]|uniref:uncharacterized protein LOC123653304 n=1 Tax=Pipistrellus kuhlii TaxID=59472 RepID=UPI001E272870|nr:uncharacterized protein LOC123653304 [Pipistrellus kuhlii]
MTRASSWLPRDPLCISLPFTAPPRYTEVIFLMDIYFFTLVSTQIADPASMAQARVTGTLPQGALSRMAHFFRKGSYESGAVSEHPMAGPLVPLAAHCPAHPQAWLSWGIAYSGEGWRPGPVLVGPQWLNQIVCSGFTHSPHFPGSFLGPPKFPGQGRRAPPGQLRVRWAAASLPAWQCSTVPTRTFPGCWQAPEAEGWVHPPTPHKRGSGIFGESELFLNLGPWLANSRSLLQACGRKGRGPQCLTALGGAGKWSRSPAGTLVSNEVSEPWGRINVKLPAVARETCRSPHTSLALSHLQRCRRDSSVRAPIT